MLWALIPMLSFGLLAFLPFAHAAVKLPNRRTWLLPATYAVVEVVVLGPLGAASSTGDLGAALFTVAWSALILVATVHAFVLRRQVFFAPAVQPAMAAALADRKLREQARAVVAGDPALARELRIGRPDLPRQFDDGGLIDVNHVPEQVLVDRLGFLQRRPPGWSRRGGVLAGSAARKRCASSRRSRTQPSKCFGIGCSFLLPTDKRGWRLQRHAHHVQAGTFSSSWRRRARPR
jgi:hypothetical protein